MAKGVRRCAEYFEARGLLPAHSPFAENLADDE
jgi:hypothetical protein